MKTLICFALASCAFAADAPPKKDPALDPLQLQTYLKDDAEIRDILDKARAQFEAEKAPILARLQSQAEKDTAEFAIERDAILNPKCEEAKIERSNCGVDRKTGKIVRIGGAPPAQPAPNPSAKEEKKPDDAKLPSDSK